MVRKCLSGMLCNGVRLATKEYLTLAFLWYSHHLFCKSIYISFFSVRPSFIPLFIQFNTCVIICCVHTGCYVY